MLVREYHMAIEQLINRLGQQFGERLPSQLKAAQHELEDHLKVILRDALSRMELLTRDEFDVQQTLLAKTRAKVDLLEQQLRSLEAQLNTQLPR